MTNPSRTDKLAATLAELERERQKRVEMVEGRAADVEGASSGWRDTTSRAAA